MRGWKWHNRKELEVNDSAHSAALRSGTTLLAGQFPTSNPVWQELVFLHTLQHLTAGQRYSSINNEAVNRAHKCPFRANFWVYVAQTDGYYRTAAVWFQSQLVKRTSSDAVVVLNIVAVDVHEEERPGPLALSHVWMTKTTADVNSYHRHPPHMSWNAVEEFYLFFFYLSLLWFCYVTLLWK